MARRRYVSTEISIDKEVNKLAIQYGDFAALLYTWMIPHAEDNCLITSDPYELLNKVVPGRRDKTEEDVQEAIAGMIKFKLITVTEDGRTLKFKAKSFYKYQSYIPERKREEDGEGKPPIGSPPDEEDEKKQVGEIFKFFSNNISLITPFQSQVIIQYLDEDRLEPQFITQVLKDSIGKSLPWDWAKSVLSNCTKKGIKTLEQYEADKAKRDKTNNKGTPKNGKPTFNNFKNRPYDANVLEEAWLKKSREGAIEGSDDGSDK